MCERMISFLYIALLNAFLKIFRSIGFSSSYWYVPGETWSVGSFGILTGLPYLVYVRICSNIVCKD